MINIGIKRLYLFPVFLLAICLMACGDGAADLEESSVMYEEGSDGFIKFLTSDPQYYGYSFWKFYDNGDRDIYEIECKKMSGHQNIAYGMLFGASETIPGQYYEFWITCSGYFRINERNILETTTLVNWTETDKLLTGYNQLNTLRIENSGLNYSAYINDSRVAQFSNPAVFGKLTGLIVFIGLETDEEFPENPVEVRYRFKNAGGNSRAISPQFHSLSRGSVRH